MIVVDSSAIFAIAMREAGGDAVAECLARAEGPVMSAATLTESLIVALGRNLTRAVEAIIAETPISIIPVDEALARAAVDAHENWGRRRHPAALNFGDCFAYALARSRDLPLLYVGDDFARTDVRSAL